MIITTPRPWLVVLCLLPLSCDGRSRPGEAVAPPPEATVVVEPTPTATAPGVVTAAPTSPPADVGLHAPWRADVVDVASQAKGVATVVAGRAARHSGFDRVVIELEGDGAPGYHVEHVDEPVRACGSGDVVPLPGQSWLAIRLEPAQAHDDAGQVTAQPPKVSGLGVVLEIVRTCDFEAQVEWVLALKSANRYRVDMLEVPRRLVVDIAH